MWRLASPHNPPPRRIAFTAPLDRPRPHSRAALEQRIGPNFRWYALLTVMIGAMASVMASTTINVAVPDMSRVFALGQERAQWLSAGFMAAMTLSMLTTPWLLERFGYRHTYTGAVLPLMAGGMCGGLARWFELALAMRVVEGLAAGVLQPIPAIIVMRGFSSGEQGRAMGIFGFVVVLAPAIGPGIGGVLVEWFGWRSIFFLVVPFCIAAALLARRFLPVGVPGGGEVNRDGAKLDWLGLALVSVVVLSLLNGMVELHGASTAIGAALMGVAAVAVVGFIAHQRRTPAPLMELRRFAQRSFATRSVGAFAVGDGRALFGSTYLVPVFMQLALHLPPSTAGAVMLPAGIALALTIPLVGRMVDRLPVSPLVATGVLLLAASFRLMMTVSVTTALLWIVPWTAIGRIGLGFVLPSLNLGSMRGLPDDLISQGASTINFMRQLGGAVGINLVGIVLAWRLQAQPANPLRAFHETFLMVGAITACAALAALRMGPGATPPTAAARVEPPAS